MVRLDKACLLGSKVSAQKFGFGLFLLRQSILGSARGSPGGGGPRASVAGSSDVVTIVVAVVVVVAAAAAAVAVAVQ